MNIAINNNMTDVFIEGEMEMNYAIQAQKSNNLRKAASAYCSAREHFSLALLSPEIQAVPSLAWVIEKKLLKITKLLQALNVYIPSPSGRGLG